VQVISLQGHFCRDLSSTGDEEAATARIQMQQVLDCRAQHQFFSLGGCICAGEELQFCLCSNAKRLSTAGESGLI